jgi:CheY-like chemotaxis protein
VRKNAYLAGAILSAPLRSTCPIVAAAPLVLLCDPDSDSRVMYGTMLRAYGAGVLEAATAAEALDLARRHPVTAAVTELLLLPDGASLPRVLLTDVRPQTIRVFVVTSDIRPERQGDAAQAGAVIRLKPFTPSALAQMVLEI